MTSRRNNTGFTVVELLIVIVVIGILASITVVAYGSAQKRSDNTKTITAVKQFESLLKVYQAKNGVYPNVSAETACLPNQYAADGSFQTGVCENYLNGTSYATSTPDGRDFKAMLETVSESLPDGRYSSPITGYSNVYSSARGISYTDEGAGNNFYIRYHLLGNVPCPLGVKESSNVNTLCMYDINLNY